MMKKNKLVVTIGIFSVIAPFILGISVVTYALIDVAKQMSKDRLQQETFNNFNKIDDLIYEITIDGHTYIVNSSGGILLKP